MVFANENRYAAGTYFPITLKKHMRAQAIAERLRLPCIYIADSGGINLPLQLGCFADDGHFGSMFYNMCRMSAMGIKQYTLSTGGNTAGGAYIVYLASESIMIEKLAFAFLAGPPMVKSAIGETVSMEDLGGAYVHTQHSGGCDHFVKSQEEGIKKLRDIIEFEPAQTLYCERRKPVEPKFDYKEMMRCTPIHTYNAIPIKDTLKCLADDSYFHEYKPTYGLARGETIVAGKMWLKGMPVGVIASKRKRHHLYRSGKKGNGMDDPLRQFEAAGYLSPGLSGLHGRKIRRMGRNRKIRIRHGPYVQRAERSENSVCHWSRPRGGQLRHVRKGFQAGILLYQYEGPHDRYVRQDSGIHRGDVSAGKTLSTKARR